MKHLKKMLALVMAICLVLGLTPGSVLAAEADTTEHLFFATDRHTNTSIIGNIINNIESDIGENELDYLGLGGDMVGSGNSHPAYNSSTVLAEVTGATSSLSAKNVDIVAGIHDMNVTDDVGVVLPYQGGGAQIYEGKNYYVYGVEEYCISDDSNETNWKTEAEKFVTWATSTGVDQSKAIFVLSHYPLHAKRDDNDGAYYWHQALNTVATGSATGTTVVRDVAFFHGHNHTVDSNEYVYNVGDTMSIQNGSSTTSGTIYYTYATAGYLNQNSKATLVTIDGSSITFEKYSTSGSGTVLTTVERVASKSLTSIAVTTEPTKTTYNVGDTFDASGLVVTATYDDGTTAAITGYTLSDVDMSTSGTKKVTVTYEEKTATFNITVNPTINTVSAETTYKNDDGTYTNQGNDVIATGLGLTDVSAVFNDIDLSDTYGEATTDYYVYDVALSGYEGEDVAIEFNAYNVDLTGAIVNLVNADGSVTKISGIVTCETTEDDVTYTNVSFTVPADAITDGAFTVSFGVQEIVIPEGYTLSDLAITGNPLVTKYFVDEDFVLDSSEGSIPLDITGLEVTATYTNGTDSINKVLLWNAFDADADAYVLNFDMANIGTQDVEISYTYEGVQKTTSYKITICHEEYTDTTTDVNVVFKTPGVTDVVITKNDADESVASSLEYLLENYVSYDFELEGYTEGNEVTVTLPVPTDVEKVGVFHVSDAGKATRVKDITVNTDGTVTFVATAFSKYVVGEDVEIEVPEPETETVSGTITTTTTKTVYVLTSSISSGKEYLIANRASAGSVNLVANDDGDLSYTASTVIYGDADGDGDSEYYIELTDATNELWTVASSYTFENQDEYLRCNNGNLSVSSQSTTWSYSSNQLSYKGGNKTYYLRYNNGWTVSDKSNNASSIYFYVPTEVEVETETTVSGTYSIEGTPSELTQAVIPNDTVTLGSTLTFTPESGAVTTTDTSLTATYTVVNSNIDGVNGDPNNVISGISGNTVTFTGNPGKALVKVTYTGTVGDDSYTVTNYISITAEKRVYNMAINITTTDSEGTETTVVANATDTVKQGTTLDLSNTTITYVDGSGNVQTVTGETIEWATSDESIATVENGVVTLATDGAGKEVTITATWTDPYGNIITDTLKLNVVDAVWALNLEEPVLDENGGYTYDDNGNVITEDITAPIVIKTVTEGETYSNVWAVITEDGENIGSLSEEELENLTFISSNEEVATVDKTTGKVTFTGKEGVVTITAVYEYADGKSVTDTVIFSVSTDEYYIPEDGTDDFPEYPNEGAIRFDKTATAVGSFSETGITQVELSMTGVPYTTGSEIDVVVMLDMTGSMSDNGMTAAEEATVAFVEKIVKNEDGSYNDNRVAVYAFNSGSSSPYELVSLGAITSDDELATANTAIRTASTKQASGGTPYNEAAKQCYDVLQAAKTDGTGNDRQQFCVFMSDGGPTDYYADDGDGTYTYVYGGNSSGTTNITTYLTGYSSSTSSNWSFTLPTEYYTNLMKADGVTVYTVGLMLQTAPSNPAPYSSMTDSTYDSTTDSLTTIGSHYFFCSSILKQMATDESKYIDIFNVDNADKATAAFTNIAKQIMDAAKDVKVVDKIADDFTMVFDFPNTVVEEAIGGQEFYIEVKDYALTPVYDTDGTTIIDYKRGTATSLMKLYLGQDTTTQSYYAASDSSGTKFATPAFNTTAIGTMYYWTTTDISGEDNYSGVAVSDGTKTYYFDPEGKSNLDSDWSEVSTVWYNMASGAYAYGTPTTETITIKNADGTTTTSTNTTCKNLVIATPYFVYNASTRMLTWTAEKLNSSELALSYFLYLEKSGGYSGATNETDAGTYETNDYAYLTYTNFNNKPCEQEFPVPQVTWNGAQVSYVFYLVNEYGQPVNRAGRVIPFSEAVYVTDTYTYSIIWNDFEQLAELDASYLAKDIVPSVYELYDSTATYDIHVFEDESEENLNNHFVIGGITDTTYVFNTKADATKYYTPATYAATADYKCKDYNVTVNADGSYTYNGDPDDLVTTGDTYGIDEEGKVYAIIQKTDATAVATGFDFSNTTVAFAVVWKPELVKDIVVVDYGLDVVVDVTTNDALASGVVGVRADAPSGVTIGNGQYTAAKAVSADVKIGNNKIGTATVESLTSVRFSLDKTNGMQFNEPAEFYYESDVNYYAGTEFRETSMYSSVTVIPATTVYYEDSFVTYTTLDSSGNPIDNQWKTDGETISATQDVDRPGVSQAMSEAYDANNVYGYDSAYTTMSKYSLGSAKYINVNASQYGTAEFSFYGTGFDVISLTSNTTGVMMVKVTNADTGKVVKNVYVDTYYGYNYDEETGEWTVDTTADSSLYQIPVMKIEGLDYAKYNACITVVYNNFFDHGQYDNSSYDFYLDAIRIYDPIAPTVVVDNNNTVDDSADDITVSDIYVADGEGWPVYYEIHDSVLAAAALAESGNVEIAGVAFMDGISETAKYSDYVDCGPNNEIYLASGQAIAFGLDLSSFVNSSGKSIVDSVQFGIKNAASTNTTYKVFAAETIGEKADVEAVTENTLSTTTDMYYNITALKDNTVVIMNTGSGMLSLTNVKITFTEKPSTTGELFYINGRVTQSLIDTINSDNSVVEGEKVFDDEQVITVTVPETAVEGTDIDVTVNTTDYVDSVSINGTLLNEYSSNEDSTDREWTGTLTCPDAETKYFEIAIICYNSEMAASETMTYKVNILEAFESSETIDVKVPTSATVGDTVTLTVDTSDYVEAVSVNGTIIEYYSEDTTGRHWTLNVDCEKVGTLELKVVAYNADGVASEPIVKKVIVSEMTTTQKVVSTIRKWIKTLFSWFKTN